MWPGSPATGDGMTNGAIFYGSAASGDPCRPVANGCPDIGASLSKVFSGPPAIGLTPPPARLITYQSLRHRLNRAPTLPRPPQMISGCRVFGSGSRTATLGGQGRGQKEIKTG